MNETITRDALLEGEINRLLSCLPGMNPILSPGPYRDILCTVDHLFEIQRTLRGEYARPTLNTLANRPDPSEAEYHAPVMEPKVEPQVDPMPEPVEEPSAKEEVSRTFTKEEVRAALAKARKKGVVINELLEEFGAKNFTGLPEAKYGELMTRLEGI